MKDLVVHLRACETTAPWEEEKLTGAFVQVDVQRANAKAERIFSGFLGEPERKRLAVLAADI